RAVREESAGLRPSAARARRARRADAVPRPRLRLEHGRVRCRERRAVRDRLHESRAGRRAHVDWRCELRVDCRCCGGDGHQEGAGAARAAGAPLAATAEPSGPRMKPTFTIGIEEEYQTVDPVTYD